jgi:hypothetical protein
MATIGEYIILKELEMATNRRNKLEEIGAPEIMISGCNKCIEDLKNGKIEISGSTNLLEIEYVSSEVKKGRGGKVYISFNGFINYFPNAKYGKYIAENK